MDYFLKLWQKKTNKDASKDKRAIQKLRREVEQAKRILSTSHQTSIEIENFHEGQDLVQTLTRAKFEELNADLFKKTLGPVQKVLEVCTRILLSSIVNSPFPTGFQAQETGHPRSRVGWWVYPYT
jgi:molecular chaperone DnaK (HSP70)